MSAAETSPTANTAGALPLEGVRILDLSRLLPGPFATQLLADLGAEVIKVEDTRQGDGFRQAQPMLDGESVRHLNLNRNKRCLSIDLKSDEGRRILLRLAEDSHVLLEQFRPGVMARLGLDYAAVRAANPAIVYCSLSGFGQDGPLRDLAAHDPNYLALSGILSLLGGRQGPPAMSGVQIADISAALMAAIGILAAVRRAERTGLGDFLDISLFGSVIATAVTAISSYVGTGKVPTRGQERHDGGYPVAGIFETADHGYVTVCAIEEHFWRNLCRELGREDWYAHGFAEGEQADRIRDEMAAIFRTRTRDEWAARFRDKDACVSPVLSLGEALSSDQARHIGALVPHSHPVAGEVALCANPIRLRDGGPQIRRPAGRLGEHSAEILGDIGYDPAAIQALAQAGIVRLADE
jgi:crotonobetainyl-CoA:carnitine CoA-transferase CaiB-like acyl-CoA transferase